MLLKTPHDYSAIQDMGVVFKKQDFLNSVRLPSLSRTNLLSYRNYSHWQVSRGLMLAPNVFPQFYMKMVLRLLNAMSKY